MGTEIKAAAIAAALGPFAGDAIVKARVLAGFPRQQLKPVLSVGKLPDLLTVADLLTTRQVTPVIDSN